MAKTKQEWLYQLRRCSSVNTLEKIIHKNRDSLSTSERESFNSAADHRRSEERRVGKGVFACVDLGGRRIIKKKNQTVNLRDTMIQSYVSPTGDTCAGFSYFI